MSADYNKENCDLKHEIVEKEIESHEKRISNIERSREEKNKNTMQFVGTAIIALFSILLNIFVIFIKG